jgi:hypothetical protein
MTTCFDRVLNDFGWTGNGPSNLTHRWVFLLLSTMSDSLRAYNTLATDNSLTLDTDVYADHYRETLRRLESYIGTPAYMEVAQLFTGRIK